jgi:hypothetical protein
LVVFKVKLNLIFILLLIILVCDGAVQAQNTVNSDSITKVNDSIANAKLQYFIQQAERLKKENDSLKQQRDNKQIQTALPTLKNTIKVDSNEFVYKGNVYRRLSGYLTLSAGPAFNLKPFSYKNPIIGMGLTLRFNKNYTRLNYSNIKFDNNPKYRNQYFNVLLGSTKQYLKKTVSYYFGLSYSFLWRSVKDVSGNIKPNEYGRIGSFGIYGEYTYFYKPLYDIGIGPTVFVNLDFINPIAGIKLDLYFANSFKRKQL